MKDKIAILKENSIRITPQRLGVYEVLCNENKHLTVEQIYRKIKVKFPAVSLSTVYTILELYCRKNLVREMRITFNKSCFDGRMDSHHHFYCKKCAKIFDIDLQPCPTLQRSEVNGHLIQELQGYFYGICCNCRVSVDSNDELRRDKN
ncbi:MAG: transcriptional repressor [Candidatus Omnitrophica bacterium]|nr:transcriptional repressor [Candidatus Omnitrophota bacterium]